MNLQIEPRHLSMLKKILNKYPYRFYAYGSRAKGTAWKFSDLDLCYQENIPKKTIYRIKDELEESNLPFFVELVDWKHMNQGFKELISNDLVLLT